MSEKSALYHFYALTGIPVRMYRNGEIVEEHGKAVFSEEYDADVRRQFSSSEYPIAYQLTPELLIYGFIGLDDENKNSGVIMGPLCMESDAHQAIQKFSQAFRCPVSEELWHYYESLVISNLGDFFARMDTLYLSLGRSLPVKKGSLYHLFSDHIRNEPLTHVQFDATLTFDRNVTAEVLMCIENGEPDRLRELYDYALPAIRMPEYEGLSPLRCVQNMFISSVAICSRAAIRGGMDYDEAILSSDRFIERIERYRNVPEVLKELDNMMAFYAEKVRSAHAFSETSDLVVKTVAFIQAHLREKLTVNRIAKELHQNAAYLSHHFKEKTDVTITQYILQERIKEAKQMLISGRHSLLEISQRMGFSSQQYFQSQFKKETGMTPAEFRNMAKKP